MPEPPAGKTLHLTNAYHPTSGGIRTVYRTLLSTAEALERQIRLVVPGPRNAVETVGRFGVIYHVAAPRAFAVDRRYRLILPTKYLVPWVDGLRQILRAEQPDIIEVCDKHSLPYLAGLLRRGWVPGVRRPTLVAMSAERFDDNVSTFVSSGRAASAFARWYMRDIYAPMFDVHLANSVYTAQELLDVLPAHRRQAVRISPPSLAADAFDVPPRADARAAMLALTGGDTRTRVLAYVGRLSREKNLGLLVDSLARLMAGEEAGGDLYHLAVAGEGPERALLEHARARLGGRLHLVGNLSGGVAVRHFLAGADLFVHPNPREPFGLAPLEAMACRVPVVVPDTGGVCTYATEETAWVARPTPQAFAQTIRRALEEREGTAARVAAAAMRATEFREQRVVPRYFAMLDALHRQRVSGQAGTIPEVIPGTMASEPAASR